MQIENQPGYRYLYSLRGYQYCDLLLAEGKMGEVKERARETLEWMTNEPHAPVLTVVLDKLSLGRAWLAEAASEIKDQKSNIKVAERDLDEAGRWLNEAADGLRKAGQQQELPRGLLARAG